MLLKAQKADTNQLMQKDYRVLKAQCSESPAVSDYHRLRGSSRAGAHRFHGLHYVHTLHDGPEHGVLPIEVGSGHGGDEELAAVGVRASVGHGQQKRAIVLELKVLVSELGTVDALAASAVAGGKISALAHELGDDAVELTALIVQRLARLAHSLLPGAEGKEVVCCFRHDIGAKLEHDAAGRSSADVDVEVCSGVGHWSVKGQLAIEVIEVKIEDEE